MHSVPDKGKHRVNLYIGLRTEAIDPLITCPVQQPEWADVEDEAVPAADSGQFTCDACGPCHGVKFQKFSLVNLK
jgi:hypothetical protein